MISIFFSVVFIGFLALTSNMLYGEGSKSSSNQSTETAETIMGAIGAAAATAVTGAVTKNSPAAAAAGVIGAAVGKAIVQSPAVQKYARESKKRTLELHKRETESGGVFFCLKEGTLITTSEGEIPIEDLNAGDQVVSFDLNSQSFRIQKITAVRSHKKDFYYAVALKSGRVISMTEEHPIYLYKKGVYRSLEDIIETNEPLGVLALNEQGDLIEDSIVNILFVRKPTIVYSITIADADGDSVDESNYFAEGLLVHNKD